MTNFEFAAYQLDEPTPWHRRFEDERVRMVLEEFQLLRRLRDLLADSEAEGGERRLTFQSFYRLFPTFPILLATRCRSRVPEHCGPAALFRKFEDVFLMQSYLEVFARSEESALGRPIGVVVPFDGYRGGVVVHNAPYDTRGTRMTHDLADDRPPHRVTVEPFPTLLEYLARGAWTPDSPWPEVQSSQRGREPTSTSIPAWMARELGDDPLVLLGWLRKTLLSESALDRRFVRRLECGQRCVEATHAQVAAEIGLSEQRVKRGLATLRARGLVAPPAPKDRSCIILAAKCLK